MIEVHTMHVQLHTIGLIACMLQCAVLNICIDKIIFIDTDRYRYKLFLMVTDCVRVYTYIYI